MPGGGGHAEESGGSGAERCVKQIKIIKIIVILIDNSFINNKYRTHTQRKEKEKKNTGSAVLAQNKYVSQCAVSFLQLVLGEGFRFLSTQATKKGALWFPMATHLRKRENLSFALLVLVGLVVVAPISGDGARVINRTQEVLDF